MLMSPDPFSLGKGRRRETITTHGACNRFSSIIIPTVSTIFKTSVHVTNYRPVKRNTDLLQNPSMRQPVQIGPDESFV